MTFEEYCTSKKINFDTFQKEESKQFLDLKFVFDQVSIASFEQQKLFLINKIRRRFILN